MINIIIGILSAAAVLFYAIQNQWGLYMQTHSIVVVFGGSIAVFFLATPEIVTKDLFRKAIKLMFKNEEKFDDYREQLAALAKNRYTKTNSTNVLINYAQDLWEQGVDSNLFIGLISQKKDELDTEIIASIQCLKNLGKYPPTLGMIGTVVGMISMFNQLQSAKDQLGEHLAVAMTATFFGLALTNLIISPMADRLSIRHLQQKKLYNNIYQIILLINNGEAASIISGKMEPKVA
jgi:chemotaxis protein MotA